MRLFELLRDGLKFGEGIVWEHPKQEDGFRVDVQCQDLDGNTFEMTFEMPEDCEAACRNHGEKMLYLDSDEANVEQPGKLPSEQITEWQWEEYRRMRKVRGDEDTNRFFEHELRTRDPLLLRAVIRYLDEQHRKVTGRAPAGEPK